MTILEIVVLFFLFDCTLQFQERNRPVNTNVTSAQRHPSYLLTREEETMRLRERIKNSMAERQLGSAIESVYATLLILEEEFTLRCMNRGFELMYSDEMTLRNMWRDINRARPALSRMRFPLHVEARTKEAPPRPRGTAYALVVRPRRYLFL